MTTDRLDDWVCNRFRQSEFQGVTMARYHKHNLLQTKIGFALLLAAAVSIGCQPVSSRSNGGGLFGGNSIASNQNSGQIATGLNGGFGQSVFGNRANGGFQNQGGFPNPGQVASNGGSGSRAPGSFDPRQSAAARGFNVPQTNDLNQRALALDADNQLLNTELASLRQRLQLANDYSQTLKQQLADNANQVQQFQGERNSTLQQLAATRQRVEQLENQARVAANAAANPPADRYAQAGFGSSATTPSQLPNAATLGANNTLLQRINRINIPGAQARLDGDVIRIEFPSDRMFTAGTYQIQPAQLPALQNLVGTIRQNFPRQIVGVEAHWDGTPLTPATTTHHQLTATQALAVFDRLVALGIPRAQLFTMALGSNRSRYSQAAANGSAPNRRIELVIYPETFDGT